jgi:hypothetical protein
MCTPSPGTVRTLVVLAALALVASACADTADETAVDQTSAEDTAAADPTDTSDQATTDQGTSDQATSDLSAVWILDEGETSAIVDAGSAVNVQDVGIEAVDGVEYLRVVATGLPDYTSTIDADQLEFLSSRPNADTDFDDGSPTVEVGDTVTWGADIGYVNDQCAEGAGQGYWPPGPGCPTTQATEAYFPLSPTMAAEGEEAETGLGKLGLWVNGVSIYGWGDGMSYENGGVWQNLAPPSRSTTSTSAMATPPTATTTTTTTPTALPTGSATPVTATRPSTASRPTATPCTAPGSPRASWPAARGASATTTTPTRPPAAEKPAPVRA